MKLDQLMTTLRKKYKTDVKPLIDKKEYFIAKIEMANIMTLAQEYEKDIINMVHCGLSYIVSANMLLDELKKEKIDLGALERKIKMFETYSAQTKLPLR